MLKRGRGSQRQTTVLVSVESKDAGEDNIPKKHGKKVCKVFKNESNRIFKERIYS